MMQAVGSASKVMGQINAAMPLQATMQTMGEFARQNEIMEMREETLDEMLTDAVRWRVLRRVYSTLTTWTTVRH
jgi:hypothetical protein